MTTPTPPMSAGGLEPPMFLQRPSSARSQDVTHVLARTFRQLFTREAVGMDTLENLHKSRGGEDEYHEQYVRALKKVQEERDRRMSEAAMLERHIMQAQARAMSADERALNRVSSGYQKFPDLGLPPSRSHFRSCIDSELMKKHNLITPEDFTTEDCPPVPPPQMSPVPHYAKPTHTSTQKHNPRWELDISPPPTVRSSFSDQIYDDDEDQLQDYPSPLQKKSGSGKSDLWKRQINPEQREQERTDLANLDARVNYLKNPRHVPPSAAGGGRTLIKQHKKKPKELGIKPKPEKEIVKEPSVVFLASPEVVRFTEYSVGHVYEMTLELKNVSTVLRPVRVIPPKTTHFSIGLGHFPGEQGLVAPGMSCHYTIRFAPDSLGDFEDQIQIQTQSSAPLIIRIEGRREPPVLTLPENIDVGHCLVGGTQVGRFLVKNEGGAGRFCLMPKSSWPATNFKSFASSGSIHVAPFEIRPPVFELGPGQTTSLQVIFSPGEVETYSSDITLVCDNCQVRHFTITGEGQEAGVELESVEGGDSQYQPGEIPDITAQHLIRFDELNPYTYVQRGVQVKNTTNVDLPFVWVVVKPHIDPSDPERLGVKPPYDRIEDVESAFSIEPQNGVLQAGGVGDFLVTYAPPEVKKYHSVMHMVLREIPKSAALMESQARDRKSPDEGVIERTPSYIREAKVGDITALEVEVKGECIPLDVVLQPYAIYIQGQTMVQTPIKRYFTMANNSISTIFFEWENLNSSSHVVQVDPKMGELAPRAAADMEVTVSGAEAGRICHTLKCHIQHLSVPLYLPVQADIKGPEVKIENPDVNFGLVRLGDVGHSTVTLSNMCQVSTRWSIHESPICASSTDPMAASEFTFLPPSGELAPLETCDVQVSFKPNSAKSVRTVFEVSVEDGNECNVAVRAEVQQPQVCLLSCELAMPEVYVDVSATHQVVIVNQTLLQTSFEWGEVEGEQAGLVSVIMEPKSGPLLGREELEINVHFTSHTVGELSELRVPCTIAGMEQPLYLSLLSDVKGLTVTYRTAAETDQSDDNLLIDFGEDVATGESPKHYLYIKNNSAISAPFSLCVENFHAKPPTPPEKAPERFMPNKSSQRRALLTRTSNLADPKSRSPTKIRSDLCQAMLGSGKGAAFALEPASGLLQPFAEQIIEITAFSNMWGRYTDQLICKVDKLQPVSIPIKMEVSGCPLRFQMVAANKAQKPILRFGTHVSGLPPITRQMRINNTAPFDVRLDWKVYDVQPGDDQLLDMVLAFGDPFPLRDAAGNEIIQTPEEPISSERTATDFIPDSEDTTPAISRQQTHSLVQSLSPGLPLKENRKIIRVHTRIHDGGESYANFRVNPPQLVVPARGTSCINVSFIPESGLSEGTDCSGYALGFMSLADSVSQVERMVERDQGYDVEPLRLDMTAHVKPSLLRIECSEDEGMVYHMAVSDLMQSGKMQSDKLQICSALLSNNTETPMSFRLLTSEPFFLLTSDPASRQPQSQLLQTDMITLMQQQNMKVYVAFQLNMDLLGYLDTVNEAGEAKSQVETEGQEVKDTEVKLEMVQQERRLSYSQDLIIHFQNNSKQVLPLRASLSVPSLYLSKQELDYGTCLVGQEREMEISLTNPTCSDSYWAVVIERKNKECTKDTFSVTPSSGMLEAYTSHVSKNKVQLKVRFTAKHTEPYEAVFLFHGLMGEEPQRLHVKGQGSYDGRHEALVDM